MKLLTAFYDFATSPASYDFLKFLAGVASVKKAAGFDHVHVVFVPAQTETGFRIDPKPTSTENKIWRRDNLLIPMCRLIEATHTVAFNRAHAAAMMTDNVWPPQWAPDNASNFYWFGRVRKVIEKYGLGELVVDPEAKNFVQQWQAGGDYVTVTMRETYAPVRNSVKPEWQKLIAWLEDKGERVIVVPDTEQAGRAEYSALGGIAAVNPLVRHALYAGANMNLGVGGGTQCLCWFGGLPFISFKMKADYFNGTEEWFRKWGLPVGEQLPWATDMQRIVWTGPETFEEMRETYKEVMQC